MWFYYATRRTIYINSSYLVGEPLIKSVVLPVLTVRINRCIMNESFIFKEA